MKITYLKDFENVLNGAHKWAYNQTDKRFEGHYTTLWYRAKFPEGTNNNNNSFDGFSTIKSNREWERTLTSCSAHNIVTVLSLLHQVFKFLNMRRI